MTDNNSKEEAGWRPLDYSAHQASTREKIDITEPEHRTALQIAVYAVNCSNTDEYIDEVARLIEEYRQCSPESKWVSVNDPPKDGMRVFIAYKFGVAEGFYWGGSFLKDLQTPFPEPTHWQELPSPPIEETN